jgi:hypothetical protein
VGTWIASHAKPVIGAVAGVVASVISLITALDIVHWTAAQTSLVSAESAAILAFIAAVTAHFWPGTSKEPVALAASFTALVAATASLGTAFTWWNISTAQTSALVGVLSAAVGLGTSLIARSVVTAGKTPVAAGNGSGGSSQES